MKDDRRHQIVAVIRWRIVSAITLAGHEEDSTASSSQESGYLEARGLGSHSLQQ